MWKRILRWRIARLRKKVCTCREAGLISYAIRDRSHPITVKWFRKGMHYDRLATRLQEELNRLNNQPKGK